jgi:hypothetical protein
MNRLPRPLLLSKLAPASLAAVDEESEARSSSGLLLLQVPATMAAQGGDGMAITLLTMLTGCFMLCNCITHPPLPRFYSSILPVCLCSEFPISLLWEFHGVIAGSANPASVPHHWNPSNLIITGCVMFCELSSPVGSWACVFVSRLRATSHTRLRARDQYISSTVIGGKGGAGPCSLHATLEGPTEYVNARWM